jgi:hypothetical protein
MSIYMQNFHICYRYIEEFLPVAILLFSVFTCKELPYFQLFVKMHNFKSLLNEASFIITFQVRDFAVFLC